MARGRWRGRYWRGPKVSWRGRRPAAFSSSMAFSPMAIGPAGWESRGCERSPYLRFLDAGSREASSMLSYTSPSGIEVWQRHANPHSPSNCASVMCIPRIPTRSDALSPVLNSWHLNGKDTTRDQHAQQVKLHSLFALRCLI